MKQFNILFFALLLMAVGVSAQQHYNPTEENLKNREEFQDMKFGVFIHWGIYSMMADGEWIMNNKNINQQRSMQPWRMVFIRRSSALPSGCQM